MIIMIINIILKYQLLILTIFIILTIILTIIFKIIILSIYWLIINRFLSNVIYIKCIKYITLWKLSLMISRYLKGWS